ncbi:hypothetical protein LEP1GSC082_4183 [Leptospira kirschneri str. H2]|nr:hypothetical protein LEP1GSC082_4183 [Leptospira kirschneri str. H2]
MSISQINNYESKVQPVLRPALSKNAILSFHKQVIVRILYIRVVKK